jgi:uncharacterized protein
MSIAFHLSIPISNKKKTIHFYESILGAKREEKADNYFNMYLYGAQLTFHLLPDYILRTEHFHYGFNMNLDEYQRLYDVLVNEKVEFILKPDSIEKGKRSKMIIKDPDGYMIEFKYIE